MATIIIAKNNTGGAIFIQDLGIEVPGSGNRTLTSTFTKTEISTSSDLYNEVSTGNITINDGITDLSISNGLKHINFETQYEDVDPTDSTALISHKLSDHIDVSVLAPNTKYTLKYNSTTGLWTPSASDVTTDAEDPPDSTSSIWISPEDRMPFFYDSDRGEWLSISRHYYTFNRSGNADGSYLAIGGWFSVDFYYIPNPIKITNVFCKIAGGNTNKTFSIRNNSTEIFNFSLSGSQEYIDNDSNYNIDAGTILRVYVSSSGGSVSEPVVQLISSWRYIE